ncbi:MAG TPA: peptidylprolyl isomerase [Sulfuricaulis sp.]|nr:peptidylprolyl isomerase [Sulfuricaulis sp.]
METDFGNIDIELYDDEAPKTVVNFLRYAGRGHYNGSIIHRSVPGFIIQGGGHKYVNAGQLFYFPIQTDPPVKNEFSPSRSNLRGTIAMAKTSDPDSATSQWFFNLADNSADLDDTNNSGGFTVFGEVLDTGPGTGMDAVDAIASLTPWNASGIYPHFGEIPLNNYVSGSIQESHLVTVNRIPNVKSTGTMWGTLAIFTADPDMSFGTAGAPTIDATALLLSTFTPPTGKTAEHIAGVLTFTATGTMGPSGRRITLLHGSTKTPSHYYAYGKTPDDPTDHWYDFTFDGTTGAEISGDRIVLHFVDGQRGDNDLAADNSIIHAGSPVLMAEPAVAPKIAGCAIAATPWQTTGNGDWILISMFLAFVALVRRRIRH